MFWNREFEAKFLNSQNFATNSQLLKNWLRINTIQLRTSGTDNDLATNPKIYRFVGFVVCVE